MFLLRFKCLKKTQLTSQAFSLSLSNCHLKWYITLYCISFFFFYIFSFLNFIYPPMGCGSSTADTTGKAKTAAERKLLWKSIQKRLPREKTSSDKKKRIALFEKFDTNNSGKLSEAEVYRGCKEDLKLDEFTDHLYDIVKRAFSKAKDMGNRAEGEGDADYVEFLEFRLFLCYIYDYFELTVMFDDMDTSGNQLLTEKEFVKEAPRLREWGIELSDPEAEFKKIDSNGSGSITFDEFADWATARKLAAGGDPDEGVLSNQPSPQQSPQKSRAVFTATEDSSILPTASRAAAFSATEADERRTSRSAAVPLSANFESNAKRDLPTSGATPALVASDFAAERNEFPSDAPAQPLKEEVVVAPVQAAAAKTRDIDLGGEAAKQRTAAERKVAWERIKLRLPRAKTADDKTKRIALFKQFDTNGNKSLTMEECYNGCMNILNLDDFTPMVRDINKRAFTKASTMGNKVEGAGDADKVEFLEFRLYLCYIYDYFELTVMFDEMDSSGDMMVDKEEFRAAVPKIEEWGLKITNPDAVFDSIDNNGSGKMTFDEFARWAAEKKLDADGKENQQ
ncbi:flagellar calcium-binding protein [Angomonas deanei]|nr:flagellar calcium-binding protein [Angomonas deanei]|eukprot:EPY36402.1 flagellar calcium-binding protein [Angomonas deanei]